MQPVHKIRAAVKPQKPPPSLETSSCSSVVRALPYFENPSISHEYMAEQGRRDLCNKSEKGCKRKEDCTGNKIEDSVACASPKQPSAKKKRKEVAIFGNYRNYYGYRVGQDLDEDPRLEVMRREWFEEKDCLDIGCNAGFITIAIARKFACRSILGVDIDGARIEDAQWTLRKVVKTSMRGAILKNHRSADPEGNPSFKINPTKIQSDENRDKSGPSPPVENSLLEIVSFEKGNFVHKWHPPSNTHYNAILCLSVSKWVHLNWGDDGLLTLFWRAWILLRPGGVFILEPQPWSSYYSNRKVSETAAANYKSIQIRPEDFQNILLDKIGFRKVEDITSSLSGTKLGFDRPILVFWK